jgi:chromatin remodeling complex protein RSC6
MSSTAAPKSTGRKAKSAATTTAATEVAAPVAAPVVAAPAPAPVVVATPAPSTAAPATTTAAPATTDAAHEEVNLAARVTAAVEKVNSLRSALAGVLSDLKVLEKQVPRELKRAQKGRRHRKAAAADGDKPKKPTIFEIPTPISPEMCKFLGVASGTLISRAEVTSRVCAYAREKGLMDKQQIKADASLRKLLALKEGDDLKILNLQRFLKPHYIKPATTA